MKTLGLLHDDADVLLAILADSTHPRAPEFAERVRSAQGFYCGDERALQEQYAAQRRLNLRPMP